MTGRRARDSRQSSECLRLIIRRHVWTSFVLAQMNLCANGADPPGVSIDDPTADRDSYFQSEFCSSLFGQCAD